MNSSFFGDEQLFANLLGHRREECLRRVENAADPADPVQPDGLKALGAACRGGLRPTCFDHNSSKLFRIFQLADYHTLQLEEISLLVHF